jgi:hypothetical protein
MIVNRIIITLIFLFYNLDYKMKINNPNKYRKILFKKFFSLFYPLYFGKNYILFLNH